MTTNELIALLQKLVREDPSVGELEPLTEGCDCYGPCGGARVESKGWDKTILLLERNDS